MKQDNSMVWLICGAVVTFYFITSQDNQPFVPSPQEDKGTVLVAKKAGEEYITSVAKAFKEVGQGCLDGDYDKMIDVHEKLSDLNDEALDEYGKINELLNDVDPDDFKKLGELCISISKGLERVNK